MHTFLLCVAAAVVGVEAGWQRLPAGGMQYIIQLDPQTLEILRAGEAIESDIPPSAGEIRSYRLIVGKKPLPRETPPLPPTAPKVPEPKAAERQSFSPAPHALTPDPGSRLLAEHTAAYEEQPHTAAAAGPPPKAAAQVSPDRPTAPWLPLTFTLFGLFASLGANVFLGWIAWDARGRLRTAHREKPLGGTP
jgi:hypothetical protein